MGIFSKEKNKQKLVLVLHIGSSSVAGALFRAQASGIPEIIFSVRETITLQKTLNVDKFLSSTIKALEIIVGKIYKGGFGKPDEIFCVLASPWHVSETRIIKLEKNIPFTFTSKLAESLIQKEISIFEEEYLAKYADGKSPVKSIELKNIKTMLNGYESPSPLDKKAKELEMTIFVSISPEQILNQVQEIVGKVFHYKEIKFASSLLASFAVVRDAHKESENFLLVDIGEVTDISMVKKNILRESISFPLGTNFITRKVSSALHTSVGEAESFIALFQNNHAEESVAKKVGPVINKLKSEWLVKFQESLANISNDISIPSTIYLSVDEEMAEFFSETIKNEQFNQYTLTESKFKVVFLGTELLHGLSVCKDGVVRDPSLIVDSIYINRFIMNSHQGDKF